MVGVPATPPLGAAFGTDDASQDVLAARVPTLGTQRRCLPRQPPPRRGGLTEEVHLPAGPKAGAAREPRSAVTNHLGIGFTANAVDSDPLARTLRRFQTRQPPPRRGGLAELASLPAGFAAGATTAHVREPMLVIGILTSAPQAASSPALDSVPLDAVHLGALAIRWNHAPAWPPLVATTACIRSDLHLALVMVTISMNSAAPWDLLGSRVNGGASAAAQPLSNPTSNCLQPLCNLDCPLSGVPAIGGAASSGGYSVVNVARQLFTVSCTSRGAALTVSTTGQAVAAPGVTGTHIDIWVVAGSDGIVLRQVSSMAEGVLVPHVHIVAELGGHIRHRRLTNVVASTRASTSRPFCAVAIHAAIALAASRTTSHRRLGAHYRPSPTALAEHFRDDNVGPRCATAAHAPSLPGMFATGNTGERLGTCWRRPLASQP
jgi:hypothetical protein